MEIVFIILGSILGILLLVFLLALYIHHKVFGKRYEPDGIIRYYSENDFLGIEVEVLEIPYKKKYLRGKLYSYPEKIKKGIVIFSHGMWGSHCAYVQEIERLAKNGFKVLGIDAYGTELSDGKSILGLGNSLLTLDNTIPYIKKIYPNEKIYIMGHSWGGFAASNIAKYHRVEKIVAMSPFISVFKTYKLLLPKFLYPTLPFLVLIDAIKCGKYSFANTNRTLKSTQVDTLVLHSLDDPMLPFKKTTGRIQRKNINPHVCFHIVDGKKHNPDYTYEALRYTEEAFKKLRDIANAEEKLTYKKGLDYHKMGELDEKVFDVILDFLNS